jgi:micrococcal nuclease
MIVSLGTACTEATTSGTTAPGIAAHVVNVPDGDSLVVKVDGIEEKVRLIGVNAPEHDECFGEESARGLRDLIENNDIVMVTDIEARDQYGRLLAYVYQDGVLINAEVAARGLALARGYEPNTTQQGRIDDAADMAQQTQSGMWAPTACGSAFARSVAITEIEANPPGPDEDNLNGEWVVMTNTGDVPIDLTGWTLRDASSVHRYSFLNGTILDEGQDLRIFTGCGSGDDETQYWCADGPVWGNSGDSAFLLDTDGRMAAIFDY